MQAAAIPPGDAAVHRRLAAAWEAAGCPRRARLAKLTAWHLFPSQPALFKELTDVGALPAEEPQKLDVPTLFGRMSQAVVTVVHENGSGTGFLVTRSGRILTNQHVVEGGAELTVKYRDAKGE
jgi:S1-C subfamily serine protease